MSTERIGGTVDIEDKRLTYTKHQCLYKYTLDVAPVDGVCVREGERERERERERESLKTISFPHYYNNIPPHLLALQIRPQKNNILASSVTLILPEWSI